MKRRAISLTKWTTSVLGTLVVLWGVAGFVMAPRYGETGFFYGPDYIVRTVLEGSTAEASGMRRGDRVKSVDGVPVEDLPMQSRWRTRPVGATAEVVVDREGRTLTSSVAFGSTPPDRRIRSARELIVNTAFIAFGLWAYLSVGTPLAFLLVGIGLTRGLGSFPGPHLGPRFEGIGASIQMLGILAFTFLLLRFFLEVPRRRKMLETGTAQRVLWGGFLLGCGVCVAELSLHPALYMISGYVLMVLILPVFLLLFVLVPWSWFTASPAERRRTGLNLILFGFLVGLGPVILSLIVQRALGLTFPGSDLLPLVEVAIPLFLALGAIRHAAMVGDPSASWTLS